MARKLNSQEARAFVQNVLDDGNSSVSDIEIVLRSLNERRDETLELTPESSVFFGDLPPGPSGSGR